MFAMAISKELLEILVCPVCKATVELKPDESGLKCVECHRVYPIRDDIPSCWWTRQESKSRRGKRSGRPAAGGTGAVIRLRSLGTCVLTTPGARYPQTLPAPYVRVAVVVEERFRAVFEGNPDIERILPPGLGALRNWRPALCLNLHGGTRSAWLTALSGARLPRGIRACFAIAAAYNVRITFRARRRSWG